MTVLIAMLAKAFASALFCIAAYNLSKIPWYMGWLEAPHGLEASVPFSPLGLRNRKLVSHPTLFLAPHALMGSILLGLFGLYLWNGYASWIGQAFFGLAVIFVIHAFPERNGMPNRYAKKPLNEAGSILVVIGCLVGCVSPQLGMAIAMVPLMFAAGLELRTPIPFCVQSILGNKPVSESDDGDDPLPRNKEGYTGCPCAKFFDITSSPYDDYTPLS